MAEELVEIILQAIDNATSIFQSVGQSADEMGSSISGSTTDASSGFSEMETSAQGATGTIQDVIDYCNNLNGSGFDEAASGADSLEQEANEADQAVQDLSNDLGIVNSSMLLQLADQVGAIGQKAEGMAQDMNTASISVGQLATQTGIAEPQMVSLINTISNATFPNDEAMLYVKSLDQIGVSSENLGQSATHLDMINDAFGLGANKVNSLGQELSVLGVDMNNVSSSFNALAYANANTVGGMDNYYTFLRKYDSQFKELGFNVDQASVIIAGATQKFGGGRAALSGLSDALKTAGNDSAALEQALGLPAGAISNATQLTGEYEGQLAELASEEAEHKTLLDQLGAAWEDLSLSLSGILSPLGSVVGMIGAVGQFGLQISGIQQLITTMKGATTAMQNFNLMKTISNAIDGEGAVARAASALGIMTEAGAADTAAVSFGGLAIAEGAALWPILAIAAAIAALIVIVYEIGKAFGWWHDAGSMLEAIQAGVMRLWDAFINHPDVQALINGISTAFSIVVGWIGQAWNAILQFFGVANSGQFDIVRAVIDAIGLAWQAMTLPIRLVISLVQWVISVFNQFATGQMTLQGTLTMIWNTITTTLSGIFSRIIKSLLRFGVQMLTNAVRAGRNFVNGVVNNLRVLPGRVYSLLHSVVSRISSAIQSWINTARSKVSSLIRGITSPFQGVAGKISGALSGVASAIMSPFKTAWEWVKPYVDKINNAISTVGSLIPSFGGESAYGGESAIVSTGQSNTIYSVDSDEPLVIEDNINLSLDLRNVPAHISTAQLIEALSNKDVLSALTSNRDFQSLDAKVKQRLQLKSNRARGV